MQYGALGSTGTRVFGVSLGTWAIVTCGDHVSEADADSLGRPAVVPRAAAGTREVTRTFIKTAFQREC